jgi:hypothetical protein
MIEQLFGSKTRVKLLRLFFSNPDRSFYVREITRKVEEQINSVRRELANLLSLGLITSDSSNNKLYYEVDQSYEHYDALRVMFSTVDSIEEETDPKTTTTTKATSKTKNKVDEEAKQNSNEQIVAKVVKDTTIELPEAKQWVKAGNIVGIAYSGVYTRDDTAQADILIIGDVSIPQVELVIVGMEKEKKRELRYAVFGEREWQYRSQVRDKFWLQFMGAKKQIVLDKNQLFKEK